MALRAQKATGNAQITVLADRGYFNGEEVLACESTGVLPCVPKTLTSGNAKRGLFTGQDFIYDAEKDHYTCPAGQHLTRGRVRSDRRLDVDHYRHLTACFTCPLKPRCTPDKLKRVKRWKYEGVLDAMQARLDRMPDAMGIRRQTVEHPFATLKSWMGSSHFLTRTLARVRTEMSLHVLAYNVKRVIAICGVAPLLQADPSLSPGQPVTHAILWIRANPPSSANAFSHSLGGSRPFQCIPTTALFLFTQQPLGVDCRNWSSCPEADTHDHPHERRSRVGSDRSLWPY